MRSSTTTATIAAMLLLGYAAGLSARGTVAVSPGAVDQPIPVADSCPTFSWGASGEPGAHQPAFQLVVYTLDEAGVPGDIALEQRLPGSVNSWTPGLDRCLEPGRPYAWAIRAHQSDGSPGDALGGWSEPRLFRVVGRPALEATVAALVERMLASRTAASSGPALPEAGARQAPPEAADRRATDVSDPAEAGLALGGADFSIDGSGNVAGLSFAGDGSQLTAVDAATLGGESAADLHAWSNLTGVPAGFADGTDDSIAYAAGNQLLLNGTTFEVVEGSASGLDADLLDGLDGADFALGAETYTKTEVDALLTIDNIEAPVPQAPGGLRLTADPRFAGMRRLWWDMSSLAGVASFVVYQSDSPITEANRSMARRQVSASLYASVPVFPDSGIQHFRVEAQNVLGETGPLSTELVVDTTSRLAYIADQTRDQLWDLFAVPAVGGGATQVSASQVALGVVWDAGWSPDGSRLAYVADHDVADVFELFVASASGGTVTKVSDVLVRGGDVQVPRPGFELSFFAWSPDGSRLAYIADQDVDEQSELYVVSAAGGSSKRINDPLIADGDVLSFAWSPDGSSLAYLADQDTDEVFELYVAKAEGGSATKINDALAADRDVGPHLDEYAWSPDGTRLAYTADRDSDELFELFVAPAAGGPSIKVSEGGYVGNPNPPFDDFAWSPDGTRLVYREVQGLPNLFVTPATGGDSIQVNDPVTTQVESFAWSPDGLRIAYVGDPSGFGISELHVAPAAGGGALKLTDFFADGVDVRDFAWSPDGSRLAYLDARELYVVPAGGGGSTKLNGPLPTDGFFVGKVQDFAWSAAGARLAYRGDQDTLGVDELFVVPVTGGEPVRVNDGLVTDGDVLFYGWSPVGAQPVATWQRF